MITVITKYCNSCKYTYYPGYFENYQDKCTYFYPQWRNYGIFISTYCSAFSTDLLDRFICMKQKCHMTFLGKTQAYNMQHKYQKAENAKAMDKRRLADVYYKYTFILYKEKYNLPMEIKGSIGEALAADYSVMYEKFQEKYLNHECDVNGCKSCIVVDGHMKAHRKICKAKGCPNDPKHKSVLCKVHSQSTTHCVDEDNSQVLLNDEEYHIDNILRKSLHKKAGKWLYEVVWKNFPETTMEPKENLPRILVELFERYGNCTISTEIEQYFETGGIKYVNINVNGDTLCLPACSLEICESAYFIKTPDFDLCNTEKTKSRFYQRTGGILVMGKPCGVMVNIDEIFGSCGAARNIPAQSKKLGTKCIVYDDACHLKRHVDSRTSAIYPNLQKLEMKVDRFHFPNHIGKWCKNNMDPPLPIICRMSTRKSWNRFFHG